MKRSLAAVVLACLGAGALCGAPAWRTILKQSEAWYGSDEAVVVAQAVIAYQDATGGWPKNVDMSSPPSPEFLALNARERAPTIDNGGTTVPLRLLARIAHATGKADIRAAAQRRLRYLLDAQYANGGWPQLYPLRD